MSYRTIGINSARRYLETAILAARAQGSVRLPPLDQLARAAEVSRVTMWKAVRQCADQGIVAVKQGSGIQILTLPHAREHPRYEPPAARLRWEQIRSRIAHDILTGPFRTHTHLPSQKEMAERYSVDRRTLRKSLSVLAGEGMIARDFRRYAIRQLHTHPAGSSTIVLVLPDNLVALIQWSYYTHALQSFTTLIERECHNRGIVLIRRNYTEALRDVKMLRESMGCIFWVGGNEPEAIGFFEAMPPLGKPLAIIDYWFRFALPNDCPNAGNCLILTIDERDAMARLGRYALQSGHRHVAYFRVSEDTKWTEKRLEGVRDAFRLAGVDPGEIRVFDSRPSTTNHIGAKAVSEPFFVLRDTIAGSIPKKLFADMLTMRMHETQAYAEAAFHATNSFTEASGCRDITAWICESQSLAIYGALPFLREKKVPVPRRLSVMAHGDSPETFCFGLTTCAERMDQCLESVMSHIVHPAMRKPAQFRKIGIPNMVVVRETSGPARAQ